MICCGSWNGMVSQGNKAGEITATTALSVFPIYYGFNLYSSYTGADLTLQSLLSLICSYIEILYNSGLLAELFPKGTVALTGWHTTYFTVFISDIAKGKKYGSCEQITCLD